MNSIARLRGASVTADAAAWEQVRGVRASMTGSPWHQVFTSSAPIPSWLMELAGGHADGYLGPDSVLFRTAGLAREWFAALEEHPERLEVTCAHRITSAFSLRVAAEMLAATGADVDADVYVWAADGAGKFSARIHRLFGVLPDQLPVIPLLEELQTLSSRFVIAGTHTRHGTTLQVVPRLVHLEEVA